MSHTTPCDVKTLSQDGIEPDHEDGTEPAPHGQVVTTAMLTGGLQVEVSEELTGRLQVVVSEELTGRLQESAGFFYSTDRGDDDGWSCVS